MASKKFLTLLEGTADAAFSIDVAGRISAWNNAASELFGWAEAQTVGVFCHQILQCSNDDGDSCYEYCVLARSATVNHPPASFDLRLQTRTGKQWCNLSILLASDVATAARHAICIVRPREMRKRLEQALGEFIRAQAKNGLNGASVTPSVATNGDHVRLTCREMEVLKSLAHGHGTKAIAGQLHISSATVNNHIRHILKKCDAHSRLEAIRYAENAGVI